MLCFVRQSSRSLGYRPNSLRLCRFGFPITLYSSHATALPIRVLVNTCQPDERMFDKPQRKVPAIAPVETAGFGRQILIYGLLIRSGIHLGFGTLRSR
jgi:hypothetical protein